MRYKRIKPVSLHLNSAKNLILRQQFALKLIDLFKRNKIIISIDETWLGMTDFRKMKWNQKGQSNSVP